MELGQGFQPKADVLAVAREVRTGVFFQVGRPTELPIQTMSSSPSHKAVSSKIPLRWARKEVCGIIARMQSVFGMASAIGEKVRYTQTW